MHPVLRLFEDVLSSAENVVFRLPPLPRFVFVVHGSARIGGQPVNEGETWQGEAAMTIKPGAGGVTCWRWELARGDQGSTTANAPGMMTHEKLTAFLETLPKGELLMRGDSVAFPPGGCAYMHRHQGPGIRCLIEGGIRIDTHGRSTSYGPGGAWYEIGPRRRVRAGSIRQAQPIHPRHDLAARTRRQKLNRVRQRGGQSEAEVAGIQDLRRCSDRVWNAQVSRTRR